MHWKSFSQKECKTDIHVSDSKVEFKGNLYEATFIVLSIPDSNGYFQMRLLGDNTRWKMAITPFSEVFDDYQGHYESYLVEIK